MLLNFWNMLGRIFTTVPYFSVAFLDQATVMMMMMILCNATQLVLAYFTMSE